MESLCQVEEKRQEDLDTLIAVTREQLEVSSAIHSMSRCWGLHCPPEVTPTDSPATALSTALR